MTLEAARESSTIRTSSTPARTYEFSEFHFSVGSIFNPLKIALDKRVPRRWIFGVDDLDYTVKADSEQSEIGKYAWTASAIHAYVLGQKVTVSLLPPPQPPEPAGPPPCSTRA